MHKIAGLLTLSFALFEFGATASAQTCEYAGQTFSLGATVCECPTLRLARTASGGRGEIMSRRLACSKDQAWVNTNTLCLIAYTWPGQVASLADIDRIANGLAVAEHVKRRSLVFTTTVRLVLGIKSLIGLPERYERLWAADDEQN
jgi:hypothetical protein